MIVDDEPDIQTLYKDMLTICGFKVIGCADNGEDAINIFKSFSEKPDIILMDYRMPKKNGIEATKEILKLDNKQKIIFTSADSSVKSETLSLGVVSFINKPFTFEGLKRGILEAFTKETVF